MHVFVLRLYFYKDVLVIDCWVVYFYSLNIWKHSIFIQASFHEFTVSQELNITERLYGMSTENVPFLSLPSYNSVLYVPKYVFDIKKI